VNPIGIMQGRLSPGGPRPQSFPAASWRDEFAAARECGASLIEWLVTADSIAINPLIVDSAAVADCVRSSGVGVRSICADFVIERPLPRRATEDRFASLDVLSSLCAPAQTIGASIIVVPLLEANRAADVSEANAILEIMAPQVTLARAHGLTIALESDLRAEDLREVASRHGVAVCYDVGNAAADGRDAAAELRALDESVVEVHIKDRRRGGTSGALGSGDVDFPGVRDALQAIGFSGPLIMETPRGGDPLVSARANLAFVRDLFIAPAVVER
jgi:L-ribulose-5-phosphate 3-epimerase